MPPFHNPQFSGGSGRNDDHSQPRTKVITLELISAAKQGEESFCQAIWEAQGDDRGGEGYGQGDLKIQRDSEQADASEIPGSSPDWILAG